jgi:hypothetical protein
LRGVARFAFEPGATPDPLAHFVAARQSWRGSFAPVSPGDQDIARTLEAEDARVLATPELVGMTARMLDDASWRFMAQTAFRREMLSWMRLSRRHPRWGLDGLNAEAMAMSPIEARGAGIVLGPVFSILKALGLARPVLSEAAKTRSATAIVLFHRPVGEDPFVSGGHFYRLWLQIEAAGFGAAVLAALADDRDTAAALCSAAGLPEDRRLVSAFRIGRRPANAAYARARLPTAEVVV